MDIIKEFISEKLSSYTEPQRKGTPKGDPIGFSKVKYHTLLLCLDGIKVKDIAAKLHISPNVVSVWRTEDNFKAELSNLKLELKNIKQDILKQFNEAELIEELYDRYEQSH